MFAARFYNLWLKFARRMFGVKYVARKIGVKIGANCILAQSIDFGTEPYLIEIGNDFYSSDNIKFITHDGSIHVLRNLDENFRDADYIKPIKIGNNVFLGINVVVLPGTVIGSNVIVGAGSIVKGRLLDNSVYAGVPAKRLFSIDEYKNKISYDLIYTKKLSTLEKKKFLLRLTNNGFENDDKQSVS